MNYAFLLLIPTILSNSSCVSRERNSTNSVQNAVHEKKPLDHIRVHGLPSGITLAEDSLKGDTFQILTQRGGKDPKDLWMVVRRDGEILIKKSRRDGVVYPPGAAVEVWSKANNGQWTRLHTA